MASGLMKLSAGAVVVLILVLQWLPLVEAGWSIRDDYDFVASMNDHGRVSFHDFLERINPLEMDLGGVVNRPVYDIVHAFWMLIIGNNPPVWQSAKIFVFGVMVALLVYFFGLAMDLPAAMILTCFVGFQPAWADVLPRANAELFGMVGLLVYAIGNLQLLRTPKNVAAGDGKKIWRIHLSLVALGGSVAVASKENFCFIILASSGCLLFFSLFLEKKPRLAISQAVPLAMALIFCGFIVHGMASNGGKALYGQTFEPPTILITGFTRCLSTGITAWVPACLGIVCSVVFLVTRERIRLWLALYEWGLVGIVFLNFGFYTGLPLFGRYLIPEVFVPAFAVMPLLSEIRPRGRRLKVLCYTLLAALCLPTAVSGFQFNYKWSSGYRDETQRFTAKLGQVVAEAAKDPQKPIVFESFSVSDYEPLIAVQIYLNYYGANNPEFVKLNYSGNQMKNAHDAYIYSLVQDLTAPGAQFKFKPFSALQSSDYFTITFSSPAPQPRAITNFNGQE
jgi:hypothetical protein